MGLDITAKAIIDKFDGDLDKSCDYIDERVAELEAEVEALKMKISAARTILAEKP